MVEVEGEGRSSEFECNKIRIDSEKCINCKLCVSECPIRLYFNKNDKVFIRDYADDVCMECGHCVAICPTNAITLKQVPVYDVKEINEDIKKPTYEELLNIFQIRRSVRQFKDKPIPQDLWDKIIEAARIAPTGHNDQSVHFTVVRDLDRLTKFNNEITKNTKILVKLLEDPSKRDQAESIISKGMINLLETILPSLKNMLKGIDRGEDFWRWGGELLVIHTPKKGMSITEDCTLAASNAMLAAESLGLGTCSLGVAVSSINHIKSVAKSVKLPKDHKVGYVLTIGFPKIKYHRIPARQAAKVTWL